MIEVNYFSPNLKRSLVITSNLSMFCNGKLTELLPTPSFRKINIPATVSPPDAINTITMLWAALDQNIHQMLYSYVNVHNMCNYAHTLELVYTLFLCPFPQLKYQACTTLTLSDCPVFISVRPAVNSLSFWVLFRRSLARSLLLDWSVCVCSR